VPDIVAKRRLGVVFTRGEALAAGMTLAQLRSPAVRRVYRGVFTTADPTALAVRARAAIRLAGHGAVVCETTGLALLGVDLPNAALADTVHILLPRGVTGPQMAGIAVHHDTCTQPRKRFNADLVSVNPAECWLQAARALSVKDLVVLADGLMRRHDPILFLENLADQVAGSDGHRGVRRARKALALARAGTDSPMETLIRLALVEAGLPCPIVNHPVTAGSSYSLDMAYPDVHLGVISHATRKLARDERRGFGTAFGKAASDK